MKKIISIFAAITILILAMSSQAAPAQLKMEQQKAHAKSDAIQLQMHMRDVWQEHVAWTRNVILCLVDDLPGKEQAVNRLLQNQKDIGNAFKPYYGAAAAQQLTDLLTEHIMLFPDVVHAHMLGDKAACAAAQATWNVNSAAIADFLSKSNPNWGLADMEKMMDHHLKLTIDEAMQRIQKDYDADVTAYDKAQHEMQMMADMLTDGIVKQFPTRFRHSASTERHLQ